MSDGTPESATPTTETTDGVQDLALYGAWVVAIAATLGSLYYSEVRQFVPCTLCWYQRILMYPLVWLLGYAAWRRDPRVVGYALPLAGLGAAVAAFHVAEQKIPGFGGIGACSAGVPCSAAYVEYAGFVTIPVMAFTAFTLIGIGLAVVATRRR